VIVRESRRLLGMIGNVLQMAASGNPPPLNATWQSLAEEVKQVVADYQLVAAARSISLRVMIESNSQVKADKEAIRQILLNLLDNACRYGPPNSAVTVKLEEAGEWLRMTVHDAGSGIPDAIGDTAWEPYVHSSTQYSEDHAGNGIGLAVVRQLVLRHGGRTGHTRDSTGNSVFIELPKGVN
jgi:signal transduction histidine kinase